MTKIAYNQSRGGFGLSHEAIRLYAELKGIQLYPRETGFGSTTYYTDPTFENLWSDYDIPRADPALIETIEKLGPKTNARFASLAITELPAGTKYRIDEYDGAERIMTIDDYDWSIA